MQLWELKKKVIDKALPNLIIFTGVETALIEIYINKIEEVYNSKFVEKDSVKEFLQSSSTRSLVEENNLLSIIKNDKAILTAEDTWDRLLQTNKICLMLYDTIDKRSKFYKKFEDNITVFDRIEPIILKSKIQEKAKITDQQCDWLINATNQDYSRIMNEIDKVAIFNDANPQNRMQRFIKDGAIHSDLPDCAFDFANAVIARNKVESLRLNEILKLKKESNIKLLALLYSNFRNQVSYQMGTNVTTENSGLTKYQIFLCSKQQGRYSNKELLNALKTIKEIDTKIKQGLIEEQISLDLFLVSCL